MMKHLQRGFTLIELLLVIGIIAILAAIVIVAINPSYQLAQARNAQRRSDVTTLLNAIYQFSIDNNGNLPAQMSGSLMGTTPKVVCNTGKTYPCTTLALGSNGLDLSILTVKGQYLVAIPTDPRSFTATGTSYIVAKDTNNRVTVTAPYAENGAVISVTR